MTHQIQAEGRSPPTIVMQELSWQGFISTGTQNCSWKTEMWRATNWYWVFASVSTRSRYWVIISVSTCGIYQGNSYCISQTGLEAMPDLRKRGCVMVLLCWEQWESLDQQYTNCYQRLLWSWPPLLSSSYSNPSLSFPLPHSTSLFSLPPLPLPLSLKALDWHWYNLEYPSFYIPVSTFLFC